MTDRHVVVDHVLFVVTNLDESRRLNPAALAPLGIEELEIEEGASTPPEGPRSTRSSMRPSRRAGRARGEPAVWTSYSDRYYAAFVDDLQGNNVEAVFHSLVPITDAPVRSDIP